MALNAANIVAPPISEPAGPGVTAMPQTLQDSHNHKQGLAGSGRKIIQPNLLLAPRMTPTTGG